MGGVVNAVSSLFGGSTPKAPEPAIIETPVAPVREQEQEAVSSAVRNEEQRKIKQRRAMSGTVLTSPLGTAGKASNTLLGRSME